MEDLERAGPVGTGQRRPSRSPRSQRSRSADVDCLKKYTERRVEERRHTEIPDTSKLDPSRWIPLPKTIAKKSPQPSRDEEKRRSVSIDVDEKRRSVCVDVEVEKRRSVSVDVDETASPDASKTSIATPKKLSPTKEEETKTVDKRNDIPSTAAPRTTPGRSHSTDVGHIKNEKLEERRHTECSDPRTIATRWLPRINTSRFRYDASAFARISHSEITKYAATRWMTFVKNPSPSPLPRMNPERKPSSSADASSAPEDSPQKDAKGDSPKWEPMRKFSPVPATGERNQDDPDANPEQPTTKLSPDSNEQSNRLTQRMRDLYDFKTENEWPKRAANARRQNMWISKSSSEEDRTLQPVRRNSQDLEFNDRVNVIKLRDTKVQSDHQNPKPSPKKEAQAGGTDPSNRNYEERLRKFNERLRYSEDLGTAKPKIKERRTYSDDYEEKNRRASTRSAQSMQSSRAEERQDDRQQVERKRHSNASNKSVGSYAEVNPTKRDSRTSDASYASVGLVAAKRSSVDCKSTRKMVELPPRRAFSQTEERPASPVPPIEWNDERYVAARMKQLSERQKRDSTRYKVYLT
ncbi:uncharacterized protein LOC122398943 [Colletes gigas]|uniref:uncharacterized protein LOC122398943 n=1 Tax=Colletes gigas TaxID=935657 RepID=UPI001C9AB94B|nr:uncharacterized protein LOC122398943 [Colletes gigas]